jgi:hypothetical protein
MMGNHNTDLHHNPPPNADFGARLGGGIGAGLGALGGGLMGYYGRQAKNEGLEEMISRSGNNPTLRDYYSDPLYQAEQDRARSKDNYRLLAAALAAHR